jgi:hypothetical protein
VPHRAQRQVPMLSAASSGSVAVSELLPGERFAVLDTGHGHAWGFSIADHYVGHVPLDALEPLTDAPAAGGQPGMIGPGDALLFRAPSIKSEVAAALPLGARIGWQPHDEWFVTLTVGPWAGCFLPRRHLLPEEGDTSLDWVEVALSFLGAPYRWGGRSRAGVDCSGLIQLSRQVAGHSCRRDSDMQKADTVAAVTADAAQRGDLAFWPGHVGILLDGATLLHANAHWMRCVAEPLADAVDRAGAEPELRRPD